MVKKKHIVAIVQARMGSKRLPGKILKSIQNKPMLWHIFNRLDKVDEIESVIIATSNSPLDDEVYEVAKGYGIGCYRGSEKDVLQRFYYAAKTYSAKYVIRITGDCPLVDPQIIKNLIKLYFDGDYDYCGIACGAGVSNKKNINRFPDGLDAELFSFDILEKVEVKAKGKLYREHVTPYIWKNKNKFKLGTLYSENEDYSAYRFTVDNIEDLELVRAIYDSLYKKNEVFHLEDVIELIKQNKLNLNNKYFIGKEGYNEFWE